MTTAIDLGYRHVKVFDLLTSPRIYDSLIADVLGETTPKLNSKSALIEYLEPNHSGNDALAGKRWIVGSSAANTRTYRQAADSEKTDVALKLALPAFSKSQHLPVLYTSLPDPDRDGLALITALQGTHLYKRNGVEIELTIDELDIQPEGIGSYWLAKRQNLVPNGVTGVVDLGGKTACLLLVDEDGELIPDSHLPFATGGSYALAAAIAADPRLTSALRDVPRIDVILDAIARGSRFYAQSGVSFGDYFDDYLKQWFQGIAGELTTRWQRYFHRISRVLITGGSAALVEPLIQDNPYFLVVPNSQTANCMGLLYRPQLPAFRVVA